MHKVKYISVFIGSLLLAAVLLGFAVDRHSDAICTELDVVLLGDPDVHFVTEPGLKQYIFDHGHRVIGDSMPAIDIHTMEADLMQIPYIADVQVYKTIDHTLRVEVEQRRPLMRIFCEDGQSLYVDDAGRCMQTAENYSYKCLPISGVKTSAAELMAQGALTKGTGLHDLWRMAGYVGQHEFWSAQIMQIDLDEQRGAVMIPRVGNHEIILGSASDFIPKLDKLKAFYDKGVEQTNWNIYQALDLRYEGQVVGIKRQNV